MYYIKKAWKKEGSLQKMEYLRKLYGKATIDSFDSEELSKDSQIELEYYQIRGEITDKPYGVEIVKKNVKNDILNIEKKMVYNICSREKDNHKLLDILVLNKVTPIILDDVIEDLSKMNLV